MPQDSLVRTRQLNRPELSGYVLDILLQYLDTGTIIGTATNTGELTGVFYLSSNPSGFITSNQILDYATHQELLNNNTSIFATVANTYYPLSNPSEYVNTEDISGLVTDASGEFSIVGFDGIFVTGVGNTICISGTTQSSIQTALTGYVPLSYFGGWDDNSFLNFYVGSRENHGGAGIYCNSSEPYFRILGYDINDTSQTVVIDSLGNTAWGFPTGHPYIGGYAVYSKKIMVSGYDVLTTNQIYPNGILATFNQLQIASGILHIENVNNQYAITNIINNGLSGITGYINTGLSGLTGYYLPLSKTGSFVTTYGQQIISGTKIFDKITADTIYSSPIYLLDGYGNFVPDGQGGYTILTQSGKRIDVQHRTLSGSWDAGGLSISGVPVMTGEGNTSSFATVINLAATGATLTGNDTILQNQITSITTWRNTNSSGYATNTNLALTGSTLSGNDTALQNQITSITTWRNTNSSGYATTGNLNSTGITLTASINSLAANLVTTGRTLSGIDIVLQNQIDSITTWRNTNSSGYATTGNLNSTGVTLTNLINTLNTWTGNSTGYYYPRAGNPSGFVTTINANGYLVTGKTITITGIGNVYITTGINGIIQISGNGNNSNGSNGSQTPWSGDIDASGYNLTGANSISGTNISGQTVVASTITTDTLTSITSIYTPTIVFGSFPQIAEVNLFDRIIYAGNAYDRFPSVDFGNRKLFVSYDRYTSYATLDWKNFELRRYSSNPVSHILEENVTLDWKNLALNGFSGQYWTMNGQPITTGGPYSPTSHTHDLTASGFLTATNFSGVKTIEGLSGTIDLIQGGNITISTGVQSITISGETGSLATSANLVLTGNSLQTSISTLNTWTGNSTGYYYPRTGNPSGFVTTVNVRNSIGNYNVTGSIITVTGLGNITITTGISGIIQISGSGNSSNGSQTPWASNIDASGYSLSRVGSATITGNLVLSGNINTSSSEGDKANSIGKGAKAGDFSCSFGGYAGQTNYLSIRDIIIGCYAGYNSSGIDDSIFVGYAAGQDSFGSHSSTCLGYGAGNSLNYSPQSVAIGYLAAFNCCDSYSLSAIGAWAGYNSSGASGSIFIGEEAGTGSKDLKNSIIIGKQSAMGVSGGLGYSSIVLGSYATTSGYNDSICIGTATANSANQQVNIGNVLYCQWIQTGNTASNIPISTGRVGIRNNSPQGALDVSGKILCSGFNSIVNIGVLCVSPQAALDVSGKILCSGLASTANITISGNSVLTGLAGYATGTGNVTTFISGGKLYISGNDLSASGFLTNSSNYGVYKITVTGLSVSGDVKMTGIGGLNVSVSGVNTIVFSGGAGTTVGSQTPWTGNINASGWNVTGIGHLSANTKSFIIDHPTQSGRKLQYGVLEGPEHSVYLRGKSCESFIPIPEYWEALVRKNSITVSLTPIGSFRYMYVESIENSGVRVKQDCMENLPYYYHIFGERKDVPRLEVEI